MPAGRHEDHHHMVSHLKVGHHIGAERLDDTGSLVAQSHGHGARAVAIDDRQVRMAKACGLDVRMIDGEDSAGAVFVLTLIFRNEIFTIYSGDGIAPEAASIIMIFVAFVSFPEAYGVIGSSILRGSGRTAEVAAYSFFSVTLLRPIMTGLFLYGFGLGLTGVWMALVLDQMIRATCAIYFMRKLKARGWDRILADMA